jgi:peptide/nickel transport system substrate-binding protein
MRRFLFLILAAATLLAAPAAFAQENAITIGRKVSTTAMDPGFLREAATIVDNIFDTLVMRDALNPKLR